MGTAGVNAQVRIGGNTAPNAAAVLDLNASDSENGTKALVLPRVSLSALTGDAAKLAGQPPLDGMLVYNTNTGLGAGLYCWVTNKWIKLTVEDGVENPSISIVENIDADYTALATDEILLFTTTGRRNLTLPTTGVTVGHKLYICDNGVSNGGVDVINALYSTVYKTVSTGHSATLMYVGNGKWAWISGY
jgi:hypothetical protein